MAERPPTPERPMLSPDAGPPGFWRDVLQTRYREVTLSAIIFGIIIGAVMNAAITYAGLKIGFTIGGSAIAAILGFGVLRGLLRRGSILENNIGQTVASAVNLSNAGIIFTVPVLYLLLNDDGSLKYDFNPVMMTLACVAGAVLGCTFIIPLRKQMIDIERLRFPSATAVGAILKSPGAGVAKTIVLLIGIAIAMLIYFPTALPSIRINASLDELPRLVEQGKISPADRDVTHLIDDFITSRSAPDEVIAQGAVLHEVEGLRASLARLDEEDPQRDVLQGQIDERLAQAESLGVETGAPAPLALGAWRASEGEIEWSALHHRTYGWATKPLPGYSDLGWRLSREVDTEAAPVDLDGDGQLEQPLTRACDRNGDGRADLILTDTTVDVGRFLGLPDQIQLVLAIAPFAIGAGYLTGRAGLVVLAGGLLAYFVINPVAFAWGWTPPGLFADQVANYGRGAFNQPLGIGLLLGGALMGVLAALPAIKAALSSVGSRSGGGSGGARKGRDELGLKPLIAAAVLGTVLLFIAAEMMLGDGGAGLLGGAPKFVRSLVIALVGAGWIWFAGIIIAQCTGMTDWSPISGLALLTVVLVMALAGPAEVVGAVLIGAALCVAISGAADMMADLRTGYIVGAQPKRQQVLELFAVGLGPIITMAALIIIVAGNKVQYGVALGGESPLVAPQAQALRVVIEGVQGGELPYALYGFGAVLGILLGLGSFAGLGVLVGLSMYLPIIYILPYGIGCIINIIVGRIKGRAWAEEWGVPLCAGLIVGEAILALLVNSVVIIQGSGG
jgi:uncharacterized oligopeptide transporter (OPT) family protein